MRMSFKSALISISILALASLAGNPARATEVPLTMWTGTTHYEVQVKLPFAAKGEVSLFKKGDELVVEIGTLRRHVGLPTSMATLSPSRAKLENKILTVEMREG